MRLKIRHKLFLSILAANILLAASIYLLSSWAFGSSFRDYLDQSAAEKLKPLTTAISEKYQQHNNWRWVKNRRAQEWRNLIRHYVLDAPRPNHNDSMDDPADEQRRHHPDTRQPPQEKDFRERGFQERDPRQRDKPPLGFNPRLLLADENQDLIIGNPEKQHDAYWIPIVANQATVGYLGFVRTLKLTSRIDQLFASKLQTSFIWITLGLVVISTLIALPVARLMVKPVIALRQATSDLADGKYETRIAINSHDEIGELSQDFNHLAEALKRNLSARQQWIADISHELRTPIAILQGEIEAMQDGIRNLTPEAINSLHQEIVSLSRLVNDLHELSLSDMGALSYEKENVNIIELINAVIHHCKEALAKKSLSVSFKPAADNITISGDAQRLTQLFTNLINNSMFYTNTTGSIDITISQDKNNIRITWADSAPGVDDQTLPLLFDRLYRVESSRNRNSGGSGLGLSICKNIVEAHHGTIEARHAPAGGVAMHITLPTNNITTDHS